MSRGELLKKIFKSYKAGNNEAFHQAAREIITEERKKNHNILANDLEKIVENGQSISNWTIRGEFESLPKDADRGAPLIDIRIPDRFLPDLVLSAEQLSVINSISRQFQSWDTLESYGLKPSHRILFCGPSGCGKTVTAEAIAGELGIPLLYVRFDTVVSSLLGETANNLRKVFDYAGRGTWVLFFDEFDAIGRSRDDSTEHGELKRVVNSFLQLVDGFNSRTLLIAATNFEQSLDPALWRRFDEIIRFEKPNKEQIVCLLEMKLGRHIGSIDSIHQIANHFVGLSHADIERCCFDLLKRTILEFKDSIDHEDLDWAIQKQERRKQALTVSTPNGNPHIDNS